MQIWTLILQRTLIMCVTLLAVATLTFFIINVLPGDVAYAILGDQASQEQIDGLRREMGLDRPILLRFADWLFAALQGDFGRSLTFDRPVGPIIMGRLQNSASLALICFMIIIPVSILLGVAAAVWKGRLLDRLITGATTFIYGLPEYVIALTAMLIFAIWLEWLPGAAMVDPGANLFAQWRSLVLPIGVIVFGGSTYLIQMTRTSMIDALNTAYVRTAVLKGVPQPVVVLKHALPNAMLPTMVEVGLNFGALLGGLVIIETIFNFAGVGQLMVMSVQSRDVPTIQAAVMVIATGYCLGNLIADVVSILLNPRLRS